MKFDAALAPMHLTDVPAVAEAAEALGFDCLWTSETQHNPFLPCALIAEHTQKLKMGTAIAVSFARSPADLAYMAWDLARHAGQGSYREAFWDALAGVACGQAARAGPGHPCLLGLLAER